MSPWKLAGIISEACMKVQVLLSLHTPSHPQRDRRGQDSDGGKNKESREQPLMLLGKRAKVLPADREKWFFHGWKGRFHFFIPLLYIPLKLNESKSDGSQRAGGECNIVGQ